MNLRSPRTSAFIVVALALFTDTFLYYLLVPLLPEYARTYGLSQMSVGVLFGSYAVSLLAGTYPLGALADRVGRRGPLLWGLLGLLATTLLFTFSRSFPLLLLARVLQGLSATITWTAGMALLADHFPPEQRGKAMGSALAFANLGTFLGPPISGYLSQRLGIRGPFLLAAGLILLDALARLTLLAPAEEVRGTRSGFRELVGDRTVRVFGGAMALGAGLWALLESTLPLHFDGRLGMSPTAIGLCFGAAAVTHLVTAPFVGVLTDRWGRKNVLVTGLLCSVVLLPLPVLAKSLPAVMGSMALLGVLSTLVLTPASPALADAVERKGTNSYASVFGILNLAYALGMMVGPMAGSAVVQAAGILWALAGLGLCFGAYGWVVSRARL